MTVQLIHGDCLEVMRGMDANSVDAVITDPPYGCGKAQWDNAFPIAWYAEAKRISKMVIIITGSSGLKDSVALAGEDFIDVIAARNMNGMTRSPIGYGNWLAAVVAVGKPRMGINAFDFVVKGDKPDHPSPKPIEYMEKLITRMADVGATVLDCFAGSGTTGVACVNTGRNFIGIEIDKGYYDIACKRIEAAQAQMRMTI